MRPSLIPGVAAALLACAGMAAPALAADHAATPTPTMHTPDPETQRIHDLLNAYTRCVSQGDREGFERLLLDTAIPFYAVRGPITASAVPGLQALQGYAGFRQSIFESGRKYTQRFHDVRIEREGELAQVSLRFETRLVDQGGGGQGWKLLHLLKVQGDWKIVSELYTVGSL